jgi:hypothetical protein
MDSFKPHRVNSLRGRVILGPYGKGTKSEHDAVLLVTSEDRYLLRRKDGPSFNDLELKKYIGREVECDGFLVGTSLIAENIKNVE